MIQITKNLFGQYRVAYPCPKCGEGLRSPLTEAGKPDTCPNCSTAFIVPGTEDLQRITADKEAKAQHERDLAEARLKERQEKTRCPGCGNPTSILNRDLATGLCVSCKREAESLALEQRYQDQLRQQKEQAATRAQKMEAETLQRQQRKEADANQVFARNQGTQVKKTKGGDIAIVAGVVLLILVCSGFFALFSSKNVHDNPVEEFPSVSDDMDSFDRHFPNASEEERRLTRELYENDSRRRGW